MISWVRRMTVCEGATFLIASALHQGLQIPVGFAVLSQPRIPPATIVEGVAGTALLVGAAGLYGRRAWGWAAAVVAHVLALAGVFLGMTALAAGRGPRTVSNDIYHRVMVVVLIVGLLILSSRRARGAFRIRT